MQALTQAAIRSASASMETVATGRPSRLRRWASTPATLGVAEDIPRIVEHYAVDRIVDAAEAQRVEAESPHPRAAVTRVAR